MRSKYFSATTPIHKVCFWASSRVSLAWDYNCVTYFCCHLVRLTNTAHTYGWWGWGWRFDQGIIKALLKGLLSQCMRAHTNGKSKSRGHRQCSHVSECIAAKKLDRLVIMTNITWHLMSPMNIWVRRIMQIWCFGTVRSYSTIINLFTMNLSIEKYGVDFKINGPSDLTAMLPIIGIEGTASSAHFCHTPDYSPGICCLAEPTALQKWMSFSVKVKVHTIMLWHIIHIAHNLYIYVLSIYRSFFYKFTGLYLQSGVHE